MRTCQPSRRHVVDSINHPSAAEKESTNDQFHDGIRIGSRSVKDGNTKFRHASNRDIVGTSSASVCVEREREMESDEGHRGKKTP
eukprot:scaffold901_cov167-Amphora_coffeaeformis.AAC.28